MGNNGNNGSNGNNGKKNGKKFIEIMLGNNTKEKVPEPEPGFKPTLRQAVFRDVAVMCCREGFFLTQDWIRKCYDDGSLPNVKVSEWKKWKQVDGFQEWFFEPMPDPCEMEDRDMKMMEMEYWAAVRDGLRRREAWAVKEFASRRWAKSGEGQASGDADVELARWIERGGASAWKSEPAEA